MSARCLLLLVCGVAAACGCVERKMLIKSDPPGADVWVNEVYAGTTPLEHPFAFYGDYGIRVGPVRDKQDRLLYEEASVIYENKSPWYETFPIDFFFEVLDPHTLTDVHTVPEIKLQPAKPPAEQADETQMNAVKDRAMEFRKRALQPVPEEPVAATAAPANPPAPTKPAKSAAPATPEAPVSPRPPG